MICEKLGSFQAGLRHNRTPWKRTQWLDISLESASQSIVKLQNDGKAAVEWLMRFLKDRESPNDSRTCPPFSPGERHTLALSQQTTITIGNSELCNLAPIGTVSKPHSTLDLYLWAA